MKKPVVIVAVVLAVLVGLTGFLVYRALYPSAAPAPVAENPASETRELDPAVKVELTKSKSEANTVVIAATGLGSKYSAVAYELSYDSNGLIKGVNSGSKPADVAGKDEFERDVYLGTCSKNVCRADPGVTKISLVMEFTATDGVKSTFTKEYEL